MGEGSLRRDIEAIDLAFIPSMLAGPLTLPAAGGGPATDVRPAESRGDLDVSAQEPPRTLKG